MKLLFLGDVMLGRMVNDSLKAQPPEYPWGNTLDILLSADGRLCNLECVISDFGEPWSRTTKAFRFRTDAKNIAVLKAANIDAVSLANNHILDYEESALLETIRILDCDEVRHAGAGGNSMDAETPAILTVNENTVGLIAFTDNESDWEATAVKPGTFYVPTDLGSRQTKSLFDIIVETRDQVDLLIISAHWGGNWGVDAPLEHQELAHALIDAGADIIYGHSPHVFRGIELYKDKPILYSCGDFIDDYAVDELERNDESFIFVIESRVNEIKQIRLYPTIISNFQANLAQGERALAIADKMHELCHMLDTHPSWNEKAGYSEIDVSAEKRASERTLK